MKKIIRGQEAYSTKCCVCDHEFYAAQSIGQEMGLLHFGAGRCSKCHTLLNLTFDPDKEIMVSRNHAEWIEEQREKIQEEQAND